MVERGVRFVQIYSGGEENQKSWDGHSDIQGNHAGFAAETDRPIAALLEDLGRRGLLDETLVIWGASSVACRSRRRTPSRAAITTLTPSRRGWPAAA